MLGRILGEDLELVTALAPELGSVRVDPGQVEQVIVNLAVNARDAMPNGGRLVVATVNVDVVEGGPEHHEVPPGSYVMLRVTDNGEGIRPETLPRIFEPFFTTKAAGKGTGLGLSTTYGIVKQSSGHRTVDSTLGEGTTFRVYLPRLAGPGHRDTVAEAVEQAARGHECILLVEDDEMVRNFTRTALQSLGYLVVEASDGEQALRIAASRAGSIDLLLSDLVMPGMSGVELSVELVRVHPRIRVLVMSGYAGDALTRHGDLGNLEMISKPFTIPALARRVRDVLNGQVSETDRPGPNNRNGGHPSQP